MVDTCQLFKKLGCGAQFDLKRFQHDADKFKITPQNNISIIEASNRYEELNFFGSQKSKQPQKDVSEQMPIRTCEKEPSLDQQNGNIPRKEKPKKAQRKRRNEDDGIDLLSGEKKGRKPKKLSKEQITQKHFEMMNIFRKENHIHVYGADIPEPFKTFEQLVERFRLPKYVSKNLSVHGYMTPTPIQMQAIPIIMNQRELLACAPTGSGKTLAFIIPILSLLKQSQKTGIRALVVSPTRELAQQIHREFVRMNVGLSIDILSKAKTKNFEKKTSCDILISTPNRLVHMLKTEETLFDLSKVEWLVLDEGDKLFEEGENGFRDQIALIYQACNNATVKRLLFSATLANSVEEWCKVHLDNVVRVNVGARNAATDTIDQELKFVGQEAGKLLAIRQILQGGFTPPVLVFVQSKERAKELFNEFIYDGLNVDVIHSDRTQAQRENVVRCFRTGKIWILISTELMGRGIDFKGVNMVVNYDFPPTTVSYIHRIGRTGRAGRPGKAITMFTEDDVVNLRSIANVVKSSGGEVPGWMLQLKKPDRHTKKKLAKVPLERKHINTASKYDAEKRQRKRQIIEMSKAKSRSNRDVTGSASDAELFFKSS